MWSQHYPVWDENKMKENLPTYGVNISPKKLLAFLAFDDLVNKSKKIAVRQDFFHFYALKVEVNCLNEISKECQN